MAGYIKKLFASTDIKGWLQILTGSNTKCLLTVLTGTWLSAALSPHSKSASRGEGQGREKEYYQQ